MYTPRRSAFLACAVAAWLLAPAAAPAAFVSYTDPTGDTFGTGPVQLDITSYFTDTGAVPGSVVFTVNFAGTISPASAFAPDSVVGFIDLDTDQNAATGTAPFVNSFGPGPPINLGDEFYIDIGSESIHTGFVDVIDTFTNSPAGPPAPITFTSNSFTITVPVSEIGGSAALNYGIIVGTFDEPTDRAPNGADPATTVPAPAGFILFLLGFGGAGGAWWRRRRQAA